MSDYTPTTEEVRHGWKWRDDDEFDRWLAEELRKVMVQAWQEGCRWASDDYSDEFETYNPYRQGETE